MIILDEMRAAMRDQKNRADFDDVLTIADAFRAEQASRVLPPGLEGSFRTHNTGSLCWFTPVGEEIRVLRNNENLETTVRHNLPDGIKARELSLGRLLRGIVLGDWKGSEAERRTLAIGDSTLGGYLVPSPISARVIDLARNQARVLQAGALTVPLEANTLTLARVTGDPTASWKAENAPGTFSDMAFGKIELVAKSLLALIKTSVEIFEDAANLSQVVEAVSLRRWRLSSTGPLSTARALLQSRLGSSTPAESVSTTWAPMGRN